MLLQVGNFKWQKNQDFAVELLNRELKNENIVLIKRNKSTIIPNGNLSLEEGDILILSVF